MRFHILGLAHTRTTREYMACAYTQKVSKIIRMLMGLGHEVIHYGAEGSEVPCEHVTVVSTATQRKVYGDYDIGREFFKHGAEDAAYQEFNANAIAAINARKEKDDFLLSSFGGYQKPIADGVDLYLTVEMGIGYEGIFSKFRVFESYAWMHYVYGKFNIEAQWYDAVIPNYFELDDFTLVTKKQGYMAYLGRLLPDKGLGIVIELARATGKTLLIAGQGTLDGYDVGGANIYHVGSVSAEQRNRLLGNASFSMAPTIYIEPFGGVAVEAQLCGTPVLTTDWGVYPETVLHGVTGYRCRTMDDFVWAAGAVDSLDPVTIREWAASNYSMERVALMYDEYFLKLHDLFAGGWYERHPDRAQLDWLRKEWPTSRGSGTQLTQVG